MKKPRDKTVNCTEGRIKLFSPPRGAEWEDVFGLQLTGTFTPGTALLTPAQARRLADELLRRAKELQSRKPLNPKN